MRIQKSRKEKRSVEGYATCRCLLAACSCDSRVCNCSCADGYMQVSRTWSMNTTVNDNIEQGQYNSAGRTENMRV